MKTFVLGLVILAALVSCGNNDEEETTQADNIPENANIRFEIGGVAYGYNVRVIASPINSNGHTSISIAESLADAASLSLNFIFDGQQPGTYRITSGFEPTQANQPALGFRFSLPTERLSFDLKAQNVEVQVTRYDMPASGPSTVIGTFSGTLADPVTNETFEITNGFFSTVENP